MTNETYEIKVESPLLRPGITITTWVSKKYLVLVVAELIELIREINKPKEEKK